MSFREKSAWAMATLFAFTGIFYVMQSTPATDPSPPLMAFAPFVALTVIGSILLQAGLAVFSPKEASARADERERPALHRAGHWSGLIVAGGLVLALLLYLIDSNGTRLFHFAMLSLIAGQFSEYAFQILLLRRRG